jgi:anthranilate phosphoribosyltransferase
MRHAAPVRRELGVATVFNFLGPLANPARVRRQVVGVGDSAMAERMLGVLEANGAIHAMVVHGDDGLDELSTTAASTVIESRAGEGRTTYRVDPEELGLTRRAPEELRPTGGAGAGLEASAQAARAVIAGEPGPHRDVVLLNTAAGLVVAGRVENLREGIVLAAATIDSGAAGAALEHLVRVSRQAAESGL